MQHDRRISIDLDRLLKVRSTGVSVGTKPTEKQDGAVHAAEAKRHTAVD